MIPADSNGQTDPVGSSSPAPEAERAVRWLQRAQAESELVALVAHRVRRRQRRRIGLVSVTCLALAVAGLNWRRPVAAVEPVTVAQMETSATAIVTSPRREVLPDGSVVEFKDGARIVTNFSGEFRRVALVRGEAHFEVAKDASRPFIVSAQGVDVRAVGTAFSVQLGAGAVEVLVTEGRVAVEARNARPDEGSSALPVATPGVSSPAAGMVSRPSEPNSPTTATLGPGAVLEAGHRARIRVGEPAPEVTSLASEEMVKRLAWRVPQLEFSRTPLAEIITLMNHQSRLRGSRPIVIADDASGLAQLTLSGFLAADNTAGLVRLLETNFRVRAEDSGDAIRLYRVP